MRLMNRFILGIWNIGIIESEIESVFNSHGNIKIKWLKHNYKDRFFADPFLESEVNDKLYILCEEFVFYEGKGKIVRLTVDKRTMNLLKREIVLKENYHLSYPFIYEDNIIPEAYRSGALYAYKKNGDNSYIKTKLMDELVIDPTILDYDNKMWIFSTSIKNLKDEAKTDLYIYYKNSNDDFISHNSNPVKTDIETSRPGGKFFIYKNDIYRPVQDSRKRYGHFIRIMKLENLTTDEFIETEVLKITSQNNPPYNLGLHTFNVYPNLIVVDGYNEYFKFLLKPILVILRKIIRIIKKDKV